MSRNVEIPQLAGAEDVAWNLVIDLANARMPTWVLAGGLMVHLHLYEAGVSPRRATTDVDAIVDVNLQVARAGTAAFASRLVEEFGMHLQVAPGLDAGRGHRFTRDDGATIDVLAPDHWEAARPHHTIPPAETIEVPGGRELLRDRAEVILSYRGRSAVVPRPPLITAIVGKWRAFSEIASQDDPDRHLRDAADLVAVVADPDVVQPTPRQRRRLRGLLNTLLERPELIAHDPDYVFDTLGLLAATDSPLP